MLIDLLPWRVTLPAMFILRCLIVGLIAGALPFGSVAAQDGVAPATPESSPRLPDPKTELNDLFAALKRERDSDAALRIAGQVHAHLQDAGSPTINLLMEWATKAIADKRNGTAFDLLDQVIYLSPDYVEGWNRRATLNYQLGNYRKSMADINRVLALEPRHFGALAGMAAILAASGKDELALRAWNQVLEIYPAEKMAQEQVKVLSEKLDGQRT
ncbi:hypothetical protein IFT84_17035 [Rhizobium sp. CFBP 8762]|uniref:tetratricopeptide repeat protein n=2 Tax=Rhizobium sp. CFBP 8762 TaxID=2775279 RepID=UPI00177D43E8|nr:hypothetical protein [Rhizobium sp. CFBP 8762]MBD8556215.1 hypothetical protein [Rhizobium sp. CFBP 8762]